MSKNATLKTTLISGLAAIVGGAVVAGVDYLSESAARTEGELIEIARGQRLIAEELERAEAQRRQEAYLDWLAVRDQGGIEPLKALYRILIFGDGDVVRAIVDANRAIAQQQFAAQTTAFKCNTATSSNERTAVSWAKIFVTVRGHYRDSDPVTPRDVLGFLCGNANIPCFGVEYRAHLFNCDD